MEFQQWLTANGFDPATLSEAQKVKLQAAWRAEQAPVAAPVATVAPATPAAKPAQPSSFDERMKAIEEENERRAFIEDATATAAQQNIGNAEKIRQITELGQAAIDDPKMDRRSFELAMLRMVRASGPFIHTPRGSQINNQVIEAAVCRAGGLKSLEKDFNEKALEASHEKFRNGIGLLELVSLCAQQNGWRGSNVKSDIRGALRAAFSGGVGSPMADVGPSTLSISGILSNVANKFVREAFMFVEDTWSRIAAKRNVSDFKQITTYSLTGDNTYEQVAPGGELKHGTLGNETYTNQADTYGKILGIDRRDLINDDLNALSSASRRLGRGGALKLNDVFWTAFLANSSFFTTGHSNYDDGSDTLMDLTGLANAHTLFTLQVDPDSKPTGTQPAIVLVPPQLWPAAWTYLIAAPPGDTTVTKSPWTGMFRLEQSRYLANSAFTGYSAKAWYMLADPNDLPVIEVAFLNGMEMPTVETADMDFDRLGIALRGYHDFGASLQEYRGGVKMKGEA